MMIENKLTKAVQWVFNLLLLNFTYFFLILLGLGVLGFFPATWALLETVANRKDKDPLSLLKFFWQHYKKRFFKGNLQGWLLMLVCLGAVINIRFCWQQDQLLFLLAAALLAVFTAFVGIAIVNRILIKGKGLWLVEDRFVDYLKFVLMMLPMMVLQLVILGIYWQLLLILPVLFIFGGTTFAILLVAILNEKALSKILQQTQNS